MVGFGLGCWLVVACSVSRFFSLCCGLPIRKREDKQGVLVKGTVKVGSLC